MANKKILQFIGKGQITIPQEWRALLGANMKSVKATLQGKKIIIEAIALGDEKQWKKEMISLNTLPGEDRKVILEGRKAYKNGQKDKFMTSSDFFEN